MIDTATVPRRVNIFWTGGWDSTFQLLQLLIVHKTNVTPFYLIDEDRLSTGAELLTMKRIKEQIFDQFPDTRKLLKPTQYFAVADIPINLDITEAFKRIRKKSFIGGQYDWLARFCAANDVAKLQLCIHQDDKAHSVISNMVKSTGRNPFIETEIGQNFINLDEYKLFQYFTFPILNLTKREMANITKAQGLNKVMSMTWFCHNPRKGMKPCGTCNPCLYTIEEGLGWRIPLSSRMRALFVRSIIRPLKRLCIWASRDRLPIQLA